MQDQEDKTEAWVLRTLGIVKLNKKVKYVIINTHGSGIKIV